jgi:TPR repeat protein
MYYEGKGVTRDYEAAIQLFRPAAERGHATAQYNLGYMYQRGYGVTQDYKRAYMWLSKSASQGIRIAAVNRDIVENEMTPAQIIKAEDLARECEVKNYKDC